MRKPLSEIINEIGLEAEKALKDTSLEKIAKEKLSIENDSPRITDESYHLSQSIAKLAELLRSYKPKPTYNDIKKVAENAKALTKTS